MLWTALQSKELYKHDALLIYSADTGITTAATFNVSSTCNVLALVASRQDCQPNPSTVSQQLTAADAIPVFSQRLSCQQFYLP